MQSNYDTRPPRGRPAFEAFHFVGGTSTVPLHLHVRCSASDGAVASLLVYVPTCGEWFESDDMPADVRAFAVHALAVYLDHAPVFALTSEVRP